VLERVLVANRGEIARRVMRTCRRLGIGTVAVHSDADRDEPHVREADQAVRLGPAPATESYLDIERVVAAAVAAGADAVHPGYGFLAENAAFAAAVAEAGLTFIGPSPAVIRLMGDKAAAKQTLAAVGIPVVPGIDDATLDDAALLAVAPEVGVPLLVKAVAGGGGKGMRTVRDLRDLPDALAAARREAAGAFGDDRVILERLVTAPRHVEVQVFGDRHGDVVHLLERECSIQRRHQKVVEESPSPAVDTALRERMGSAAVAAAAAVGYEGAGTVEFLVAGDTLGQDEPEFFFLEMNTRLQVEHPVTELITGLDLVELQLRVAAGEPLGFTQDEVAARGHAIEVRLYAEDPVSGLPQTGSVHRFAVPAADDVRVDAGIETGSTVSRFYDPMLAKLVVHAPDRAAAIRRMGWLLERTAVHGVTTNLAQLAAIVGHPVFASGELTTGFLDDHLADWSPPATAPLAPVAAAVALQTRTERACRPGDPHSPWDTLGPYRPGLIGGWRVRFDDGTTHHVLSVAGRAGRYRVRTDRDRGDGVDVVLAAGTAAAAADGQLHLEVDGREEAALVTIVTDPTGAVDATTVWVHTDGRTAELAVLPATRHADARAATAAAAATSPMPGAVLAVPVEVGDRITAGTTLAVVEAMKMEHPITAAADGTVTAVHVAAGDAVEAGAPLVEVAADLLDDPA
jgi:acetyl-CoA/propionyl-CoA carboxylase, biotin carboxylase, biotin carboxyl carrier protein